MLGSDEGTVVMCKGQRFNYVGRGFDQFNWVCVEMTKSDREMWFTRGEENGN